MGTKTILTSATVTTSLLFGSLSVLAAPDSVVIEQHGSQITESLDHTNELSFSPNEGTIVPLDKRFNAFQLPDFFDNQKSNWSRHLGQPIRVEHRSRDLSFEGILVAVNDQFFTLSVQKITAEYPINDFYLIPKQAPSSNPNTLTYQGLLTYETSDLSWSPELIMLIDDQSVTLVQQAKIQNNASHNVALGRALLHYTQSDARPRPMMMKAMTSDMALESAPSTNYQQGEITLELTNLELPASSKTLVDLGKTNSQIVSRRNASNIISYPSSTKIPLIFSQQISFNSPKDLLPGNYQTLWSKSPYMVQGNQVMLNNTREGTEVEVELNKSLDLTGDLTLMTESKESNTITQTWELTVKNLSKLPQSFSIQHTLQGNIKEISLRSIEQVASNSLKMLGQVDANGTQQIRYTVVMDTP